MNQGPPIAVFDLLIEAATVLPMTSAAPILADAAVGVAGNRIAYVGPRAGLPTAPRARRHMHVPGGIVCPGLINLHAHLAHSLLTAAGDGLAVSDWLHQLIFPIERTAVDEAFVRTGTELGIAQMLAAGATLTVDMYYHEAAVARVAERAGYRLVAGETIIGYPAPGAPTPKDGLRNAERFLAEWSGHPLVQPAPSPHAVYTTDPDLLRAALRLCERHQAPFLTHLSESRDEIATVASRHGQSPIAYLEGLGVLAVPTIAAHVIYPQPGDVEILARRRVAVAHCPQSNLHMGESVAPLREYLDRGVPVGLGSDGSGSAPGVDLLAEAVLAGRLMKLRAGRADEVRAQDLLRLLTADAAAALRRPDLGTLTAGALADLVVFEPAGPAPAQAVTDPFARVIYATQHRRVAVTVVDGRVLYERGEYPTIDMERLRQEVRAQGQRIQQAIA